MVLIILDSHDESALIVYNLIKKLDQEVKLLTTVNFWHEIQIEYDLANNSAIFNFNNKHVKSIWFKRVTTWHNNKKVHTSYDRFISNERNTIFDAVFSASVNSNTKFLSSWTAASLNKLEVAKKANEIGIKLPETKIITSLNSNLNSDSYISKAAYENYRYSQNGNVYMQHVNSVKNILEHVNRSEFAPSYVQRKIDSLLEIRTFYFENEFFSMASKSLFGKDIDIRKTSSGIIRFPYILPQAYRESLHQLMKNLSLNIGSIDTIIDSNGTCYFLEVNPNGSFLLLSKVCDYEIESKLTKFLIDETS